MSKNGASSSDLGRRVLQSVGIALLVATALSLWTAGIYLIDGASAFEAHGTTPTIVVVTYFAIATLTGIIVGIMRPMAASPRGAALLGFLVAVPAFLMLRVAEGGYGNWSRLEIATMLIWATVLGAPLGVIYRRIFGNASSNGS